MKIYGFPTFNLTKVLLTAEELGLDYKYVALDVTKGEHKTPEHLKRHPLGKVPVLEDNGTYLYESAAICRYLSRTCGSRLYSGDAMAKAKIDQWIDFGSLHIGRWLTTYFYEEIVKTKFFGGSADQAQLAEAQECLTLHLPLAEVQLGQTNFLAGNEITLADTIIFAYVHTHEVTSVNLDAYPNILRWYTALKQPPSFATAMQHFPGNNIFH